MTLTAYIELDNVQPPRGEAKGLMRWRGTIEDRMMRAKLKADALFRKADKRRKIHNGTLASKIEAQREAKRLAAYAVRCQRIAAAWWLIIPTVDAA